MAECGHCGKIVRGIRDHIRDQHGDTYYDQGPDLKYYGYRWLKARGMTFSKSHWDVRYDKSTGIASIPTTVIR
jgi:hypothetical protein